MEHLCATLLTWVILLVSPVVFLVLLKYQAPYGRYADKTKQLLTSLHIPLPAIMVPTGIGWFVQEIPSFVVPLVLAATAPEHEVLWSGLPNRILLGAFLAHYFNRALLYPLQVKGRPSSLLSVILATAFCSANGYVQGMALVSMCRYTDSWLTHVQFVIGMLLWAIGFLANLHADHVLRNLRAPGETGYRIPRGGLFEYVSCANYATEIIEWSGFALACANLQAASFALFTMANLIPRALTHHRFYLKTIEGYPKDRKAVLPFLL